MTATKRTQINSDSDPTQNYAQEEQKTPTHSNKHMETNKPPTQKASKRNRSISSGEEITIDEMLMSIKN